MLTRRSAVDLAAAIRSGETSSRDVVAEHIEHSKRVGPKINAIIVERFDAALSDAERADAQVAEARQAADPEAALAELPALLGVPCTIKETLGLAGMPHSAGLIARREVLCETSSPPVARILAAGAIPLGVTNTSELTMWPESNNRVYGRTNNSYSTAHTAGGSSGGEGSAVGAGCAPVGLGSDIGGSIRLPAFFNGVFGHMASPGVVPNSGQYPPKPTGAAEPLLRTGPITRRAEDLMPVLRLIAGPDEGDPLTAEAPSLGEPGDVSLDGLRVVLLRRPTLVSAGREMVEARDQAAQVLQRAGARVELASVKGILRARELYLATLSGGSGTDMLTMLTAAGVEAPRNRAVLRRGGPHTFETKALVVGNRLTSRTPPGLIRRQIAAGAALGAEIRATVGDGVLLHPPFPRVAPRHGGVTKRPLSLSHVFFFNLAGTPVTQVPLGLGRAGLPLGVQVVAGHGNDHVSIAVALELEQAFGGWVPPA